MLPEIAAIVAHKGNLDLVASSPEYGFEGNKAALIKHILEHSTLEELQRATKSSVLLEMLNVWQYMSVAAIGHMSEMESADFFRAYTRILDRLLYGTQVGEQTGEGVREHPLDGIILALGSGSGRGSNGYHPNN